MFLNISVGIAHSHLLGATGLQSQKMFPVMGCDPELPPQAAPASSKGGTVGNVVNQDAAPTKRGTAFLNDSF